MLNKTVLVIERDPNESKHIFDFFRLHNFRNKIQWVQSKAEAVDFIFATGRYADRKDHEIPGLILLDLQTNKTQDLKILKPLQWYLRTQKIPIIILTSSDDQERELSEYHNDVVGLIRKPLEFTPFIEVIQHMGVRWRDPQESPVHPEEAAWTERK